MKYRIEYFVLNIVGNLRPEKKEFWKTFVSLTSFSSHRSIKNSIPRFYSIISSIYLSYFITILFKLVFNQHTFFREKPSNTNEKHASFILFLKNQFQEGLRLKIVWIGHINFQFNARFLTKCLFMPFPCPAMCIIFFRSRPYIRCLNIASFFEEKKNKIQIL